MPIQCIACAIAIPPVQPMQPSESVILHRIGPKGEPGFWVCGKCKDRYQLVLEQDGNKAYQTLLEVLKGAERAMVNPYDGDLPHEIGMENRAREKELQQIEAEQEYQQQLERESLLPETPEPPDKPGKVLLIRIRGCWRVAVTGEGKIRTFQTRRDVKRFIRKHRPNLSDRDWTTVPEGAELPDEKYYLIR